MEFHVELEDTGRAPFRWEHLAREATDAFLLRLPGCNVLFDATFAWYGRRLAQEVSDALRGEPLHYILLSHSHYDHAGGVPYVKERYPEAKVAAAEHAAAVFGRASTRRAMRELDDYVARARGVPLCDEVFESLRADVALADGDELALGGCRARVIAFPGHTRDCLGSYFPEEKLLLSCETLGVPKGGDHIALAMLIGHAETISSMQKALSLEIETMLLPHSGMLFGQENCRAFLEKAIWWADTVRDAICRMAGEGLDHEEMTRRVTWLLWGDAPRRSGGDKALLLNSSLTIHAVLRECGIEA